MESVLALYDTVPSLSVRTDPTTALALDVVPYDTFALNCIATVPDGVVAAKSIQWLRDSTVISDNGETVLITFLNSTKPESRSELIVIGDPVGDYIYNCTSLLQVPGGPELTAFATAIATIKGVYQLV